MKSRAVIIGYGETPVSRGKKDRGEEQLTLEEYLAWSAKLALEDAGLEKEDLDKQGLVVNGAQYPHSELWSCEVAQNLGISPKRLVRVDNGGESAISSLGRACDLINSGSVDLVLCISGDAPLSVTSHPYPYFGEPYVYSRDYEDVYGMQGPKAIFGFIMRKHMQLYGTTLEQTGKIAVVSRSHALLNPIAYFKEPITIGDYLNSPVLADPIRLLDNVMLVNGAHAFIVASSQMANKYTDNPVHVLGVGESYNYYSGSREQPDVTTTGISMAAKEAFEQSDLKTSDIDCFQPYDDFPIAVVMQLEDSGFCKKGDGGKFVEKTDLSIKGDLPLSTGGGQLSSGQPGLSGGHVPFIECVRQMSGEGGRRQVEDARIGLAAGIGGLSYIRNLENTGVAILGSQNAI